jgi:hypothetical protein
MSVPLTAFCGTPDGSTFTNVDPPPNFVQAYDVFPIVINPAGAITAAYADSNTGSTRGFVRASVGGPNAFTAFDGPGSQGSSNGTVPTAINPKGAITGWYQDGTNFYAFHGFLRDPITGHITSFDTPDASSTPYIQPYGINPAGAITGWYQVTGGQPYPRGFLRPPNAPNANIITFDYPPDSQGMASTGMASTGMASTGTSPSAINPAGAITGNYSDAGGNTHGLLRIPAHPDE